MKISDTIANFEYKNQILNLQYVDFLESFEVWNYIVVGSHWLNDELAKITINSQC